MMRSDQKRRSPGWRRRKADQLVELLERFEIPTRKAGHWRDLPRAGISPIPAFVTEAAKGDLDEDDAYEEPPRPTHRRACED